MQRMTKARVQKSAKAAGEQTSTSDLPLSRHKVCSHALTALAGLQGDHQASAGAVLSNLEEAGEQLPEVQVKKQTSSRFKVFFFVVGVHLSRVGFY